MQDLDLTLTHQDWICLENVYYWPHWIDRDLQPPFVRANIILCWSSSQSPSPPIFILFPLSLFGLLFRISPFREFMAHSRLPVSRSLPQYIHIYRISCIKSPLQLVPPAIDPPLEGGWKINPPCIRTPGGTSQKFDFFISRYKNFQNSNDFLAFSISRAPMRAFFILVKFWEYFVSRTLFLWVYFGSEPCFYFLWVYFG